MAINIQYFLFVVVSNHIKHHSQKLYRNYKPYSAEMVKIRRLSTTWEGLEDVTGRFQEFLVSARRQLETSKRPFLIRFEYLLNSNYTTRFKIVTYFRLRNRTHLGAVKNMLYFLKLPNEQSSKQLRNFLQRFGLSWHASSIFLIHILAAIFKLVFKNGPRISENLLFA